MSSLSFDELQRRIVEVAPGLHTAGTFSPRALAAIAKHAGRRHILHSAETGCGASTLLLSHLSAQHTVFALDDGSGSVTSVRRSALLRPNIVTFVEGPTQKTLPRHCFTDRLQLALIDGPHAFPFPEMEYYFLYPHLDTEALLIVDDIHIRSIRNLFQFLRADAMFQLDEVAGTTAFFTRTDAPTFDPLGDGWWEQNYNAKLPVRWAWRQRIARLRRKLATRAGHGAVSIVSPRRGEPVGATGEVAGSADIAEGAYLWVLVHRKGLSGWWPQSGGSVLVEQGHWQVSVNYGGGPDVGHDFEIAALIVGPATHQLWTDWVSRVQQTGEFPPVPLPQARFLFAEAYRTVRKTR
jgi:Methyltransferase domain